MKNHGDQLAIIAAAIVWWSVSSPPMPPAEAVRILRAAHSDRDRTNVRSEVVPAVNEPQVIVIGSGRTDGPWPWPRPIEDRRLDGRRWTDPELIYGQPWPWLPPGAYPIGYPFLPPALRDLVSHQQIRVAP